MDPRGFFIACTSRGGRAWRSLLLEEKVPQCAHWGG